MSWQHFNPHDLDDATVLQVATGRDRVLEDILQTVRANLAAGHNQHLLAVAPRGYGKSFLARLASLHLAKLRGEQGLPLGVALLPEEQPNITAPHLLLEEIRRVFLRQPADSVIPTWFDEGQDDLAWAESLGKLDAALDDAFGSGQGLLVALVENIDMLFDTVFRDGEAQSRLRKLLSEHPRLMLIATSAGMAVDKEYEGRLFHAFRQVDLEPWSEQECIDYFNRQLAALDLPALDAAGVAKARTLALFIGGTPRLAALLAEILASKDARKAAQVLDALMDRLTPYYKHRIESLPWRSRKLLDALLRLGEPCSQSELAQRVGAQQSAIAQPFRDLQAERLVIGERASKGRETLYRVADRVLAHYYRKRFLLHGRQVSPLEAIAEFLEAFFTLEEKQAEAKRLRGLGLEADAAVLERLAQAELDGAGSWRSLVFEVAYRLRRYAVLLLSAAMPEFDEALTAFAEYRPREALAIFRRQDMAALEKAERLLWLLLAGSAATQLVEEREQVFAWLDKAVAEAEASGIATCRFAALDIRRLWFWAAGKRQEAWIDCRRSAELSNALPTGEWRRYALYNNALLEGQVDYHETALALLRELLDSARAAEDGFMVCRAWLFMAWRLGKLERHEEAVSVAQEAVIWAERCGSERVRAQATRHLAFSLGQLGRYKEAELAAREAMAWSERCGDDYERAVSTRHFAFCLSRLGRHEEALAAAEAALALAEKLVDQYEMAWNWLEIFRQAHALSRREQALDAYLALLIVPKDANEERNWPLTWVWMDYMAQDAIHAGRWPELQQALTAHAEQFLHFGFDTGSAIADALGEILASQGQPAAFAAAASFIDAISPPLAGEVVVNAKLKPAFARLFQEAMGELAYRLDNPPLLRDIAQRIGERLPEATATLRQMLEAAALYVESGNDPRSLERVDPDIALAIQRTRMPMNI